MLEVLGLIKINIKYY